MFIKVHLAASWTENRYYTVFKISILINDL